MAKKKEVRQSGPEEWPGLEAITDGAVTRLFVAAVEDAFEALHQQSNDPAETFGPEDKPISTPTFFEWATSVEERLEFMGCAHIALGLPEKDGIPLEAVALRLWTRRVWARFAAHGQVLADTIL